MGASSSRHVPLVHSEPARQCCRLYIVDNDDISRAATRHIGNLDFHPEHRTDGMEVYDFYVFAEGN